MTSATCFPPTFHLDRIVWDVRYGPVVWLLQQKARHDERGGECFYGEHDDPNDPMASVDNNYRISGLMGGVPTTLT